MPAEPEFDVTVETATADDCFFLDVWNRSFEGTVTRLNDALNRLMTLSTAMVGGSLVLLKEDICYGWFRVLVTFLFFLALTFAVVGSVPVAVGMDFDPESVRRKLSHSAAVKRKWVWSVSACIIAGAFIAVLGVVARAYVGPAPLTARE